MVLKIYHVGKLSTTYEREQMIKLIGYLRKEFANRTENCTLIINPTFQYTHQTTKELLNGHLNALIIKDNMFVIIQIKGSDGEFTLDFDTKNPTIEYDPQKFPIIRAVKQRKALISYLMQNFISKIAYPPWVKDETLKLSHIAGNINSWIITPEGSTIYTKNPSMQPRYIKAIPLEKTASQLALLHAERFLYAKAFTNFLKQLNAQSVYESEWYRGRLFDAEIPTGLIPKLTQWMETNDPKNLLNVLKYIQELDLKDHLSMVLKCAKHPNFAVRTKAFSIILEWKPLEISQILKEALQSSEQNSVFSALLYLHKQPNSELLNEVANCLQTNTALHIKLSALHVLAGSKSPVSEERLHSYWLRYFKEFNFQNQTELFYEEPLRVLPTLIRALKKVECQKILPWLTELINSIPWDTTQYSRQSLSETTIKDMERVYRRIFEAACRAFAKLASTDEIINYLTIKLVQVPTDYQCIITRIFGNFIPSVIDTCSLYINAQDDTV